MSKKLLIALLATFAVPVYTGTATPAFASSDVKAEESSPIGTWYGSPYGVEMRLNLYVDEDGKNVYVRDKTKDGITEYGTWKFEKDKLILDEGNDIEMTFDYKEDELTAVVHDIHYRFTREKEEKEEKKEQENIKIEDFDGKWMAEEITSGIITADLETFKIEDAWLDIKDGSIDMSVNSGFLKNPLRKYDIKAEMVGDYMVFNLDLVGDKTCEAICSLMEDDSMDVEFQTPELKLNVSFSKDKT